MQLVDAARNECSVSKLCKAINFPRRTYHAKKAACAKVQVNKNKPLTSKLPHPRALSPAQVFSTLLDENKYLCSERTFYRLLAKGGQNALRYQRRSRNAQRPELLATRPNELWSWDISVLQKHGMELTMR